MDNQYCKVGAIHPLGVDAQALQKLERQLLNFRRKAAEANQNGSALQEFFEQKAQKIQKMLQKLV